MKKLIGLLIVLLLSLSVFAYTDDRYANDRALKVKSDNVGGIAIPGFKIVVGDDNTDGGYAASSGSQLMVISQSYYDAIADDKVPGHSGNHKFGYNPLVGAAEEIIWTAGNGYTYLTSAEILAISSTDVDDDGDPVDTGARTIVIEGLSAAHAAEITDTVTLDGTTVVNSNIAFYRINRAYVATVGSSETNEGLISIKNNAGTNTLAEIVAGRGQTQMAIKSVVDGKNMFMTQLYVSESANKKVRARIYYLDRATADQAWRLTDELVANLGDSVHEYKIPIRFIGPCDIQIRGEAAAPFADVNAMFEYYEE